MNDAPPPGSPDAGPVTTGPEFGSPGAYTVVVPEAIDYYQRVQYGGVSYWGFVPAGDLGGTTPGGGYLVAANNLSTSPTMPPLEATSDWAPPP